MKVKERFLDEEKQRISWLKAKIIVLFDRVSNVFRYNKTSRM